MKVEGRKERKKTLLIADDNEGVALLISKRLQAAGYHTEVSSNGAITIESIHTAPPDLLLLDFRLPDMTGKQVVAALKDANCLVPFIVVTGAGDESTAVEMMKLGAYDYLRKDLDFLDRINGTVERVFAQIEVEQQLIHAQLALEESEKRFKDIIYSMDDMVYETDAQLKITYCSDQVTDLLGYSPEELLGINPFDFLVNEDRQQIIELAFAGFIDHMPIKDFEGWYKKKDNKRVCLLTSGVPIFDSQGNFYGIRGASKDITDRKMAEIALAQNEAKYRSLIMNSTNGIILTDENGKLMEWNPAQEEITGLKAKEACGRKVWDIQYLLAPEEKKTPEYLAYLKKYITGLLQSGDHSPVYTQSTVEIQRANGVRRTVESTVFSIPTKKGVMLSSISSDITERKQAEQVLKEENELLLQQIKEHKSELVHFDAKTDILNHDRYSHITEKSQELRVSLMKIVNATNTMMTGVFGVLNDEQTKTMKEIEKSSKRMIGLINEIVDKPERTAS